MAEKKPTKAQLLAIHRAKVGKCIAMLAGKVPRQCTNWALDEKGYCGQHYASEIERVTRAAREAARKAEMIAGIDAYLEAHGQAPHECGERCPYSSVAQGV